MLFWLGAFTGTVVTLIFGGLIYYYINQKERTKEKLFIYYTKDHQNGKEFLFKVYKSRDLYICYKLNSKDLIKKLKKFNPNTAIWVGKELSTIEELRRALKKMDKK